MCQAVCQVVCQAACQAVCQAACQAACRALTGVLAVLPGLTLSTASPSCAPWPGDSELIFPASLAAGARVCDPGPDHRERPCWALAARDEA